MYDESETAQKIIGAINDCCMKPKQVAKLLANEHPTHQQQFMNVAVAFIVEMAREGKYVDLRNQCSVDKAKRIVSNMEYEDKEGMCPFI